MRDQWYGDDRNLLKWGTLIHIAQRDRISTILHVALYRASDEAPSLHSARGQVEFPAEVMRHFRNLDHIHRLAGASGIRIAVYKAPFKDRTTYFSRAHKRIESLSEDSLVVFLDPDTGLAGQVAGLEHVTADEVRGVFDVMKPGDVLACYQHARRQKDWRGDRRRAFTRALSVTSEDVEVFDSELARDVVLFSTRKKASETKGSEAVHKASQGDPDGLPETKSSPFAGQKDYT